MGSLNVDGKVDAMNVTFTLDTGATVSFIRSNLVNKSQIKPLRKSILLRTVTGELAKVLREITVKICLGRITFNHTVPVADIEDKFILGMDLIRQHGFSFDHEQNILRFGGERFILSTNHRYESPINVLASQTVKISGNSEQMIIGQLEQNSGSCVGLVRNPDRPGRCLIGKSVVNGGSEVPIRVANIFPDDVKR